MHLLLSMMTDGFSSVSPIYGNFLSYRKIRSSLIVITCRSMLRDETIYKNVNEFCPDRFGEVASEDEQKLRDPRTYIFGFGRR